MRLKIKGQHIVLAILVLVIFSSISVAQTGFPMAKKINNSKFDNNSKIPNEVIVEINLNIEQAHNNIENKFSDILAGRTGQRISINLTNSDKLDDSHKAQLVSAVAYALKKGIAKEGDYTVGWKDIKDERVIYLGLYNVYDKDYRMAKVDLKDPLNRGIVELWERREEK